jgi:hypothetical protein
MRRGSTYQEIAKELEAWRDLPKADLVARIDCSPIEKTVEILGEIVNIEISAHWQDASRSAIRIQGIAYGSSVEETAIVLL